jgi:hypothetical protein
MDQDVRFPDVHGVEHRFVELPGGLSMHVAEAGEGLSGLVRGSS